jgi:hypothetical protein
LPRSAGEDSQSASLHSRPRKRPRTPIRHLTVRTSNGAFYSSRSPSAGAALFSTVSSRNLRGILRKNPCPLVTATPCNRKSRVLRLPHSAARQKKLQGPREYPAIVGFFEFRKHEVLSILKSVYVLQIVMRVREQISAHCTHRSATLCCTTAIITKAISD